MEESNRQAMQLVVDHLDNFLKDHPTAPYEDWIEDLHPENRRRSLDPRFYLPDADHLLLWNERVERGRRVRPVRLEPFFALPKVLPSLQRKLDDFLIAATVSEAVGLTAARRVVGGAAHRALEAANAVASRTPPMAQWRSALDLAAGSSAGIAWLLTGSLYAGEATIAVAQELSKRSLGIAGGIVAALLSLDMGPPLARYRLIARLHERTAEVTGRLVAAAKHPAPLHRFLGLTSDRRDPLQ